MKQTTLSKNLSRTALTLILSAVLTLLGLSAITCYDNKYIAIVGVYDSTVDSISVVSCKIKTQYTTYFVLVPVATYGSEYYVYATEGINWFAIGRWK